MYPLDALKIHVINSSILTVDPGKIIQHICQKRLSSFKKFLLQVVINLKEEHNLEQEFGQSKCPRNFKEN